MTRYPWCPVYRVYELPWYYCNFNITHCLNFASGPTVDNINQNTLVPDGREQCVTPAVVVLAISTD